MSFQDSNYAKEKQYNRGRGKPNRSWRGRSRGRGWNHNKSSSVDWGNQFNSNYVSFSSNSNYSSNTGLRGFTSFSPNVRYPSSQSSRTFQFDSKKRFNKNKQVHNKKNKKTVSRPVSPFPGTEEYTQRNIEKASDFIKKQLQIDENSSANQSITYNVHTVNESPNKVTNSKSGFATGQMGFGNFKNPDNTSFNKDFGSLAENKTSIDPSCSQKNSGNKNYSLKPKPQQTYDVNEIYNKLISHISNLSHARKINIINQVGPVGYDLAVQQIQKQKRLELSQALRDMCNEKYVDQNNETINSIIPDFDIPIENLPKEIIAKLSNTLDDIDQNICPEPEITNENDECLDFPREDFDLPDPIVPERYFRQAEDLLKNSLDYCNEKKLVDEFSIHNNPRGEEKSSLLNDIPLHTSTVVNFERELPDFREFYQPSPQASELDESPEQFNENETFDFPNLPPMKDDLQSIDIDVPFPSPIKTTDDFFENDDLVFPNPLDIEKEITEHGIKNLQISEAELTCQILNNEVKPDKKVIGEQGEKDCEDTFVTEEKQKEQSTMEANTKDVEQLPLTKIVKEIKEFVNLKATETIFEQKSFKGKVNNNTETKIFAQKKETVTEQEIQDITTAEISFKENELKTLNKNNIHKSTLLEEEHREQEETIDRNIPCTVAQSKASDTTDASENYFTKEQEIVSLRQKEQEEKNTKQNSSTPTRKEESDKLNKRIEEKSTGNEQAEIILIKQKEAEEAFLRKKKVKEALLRKKEAEEALKRRREAEKECARKKQEKECIFRKKDSEKSLQRKEAEEMLYKQKEAEILLWQKAAEETAHKQKETKGAETSLRQGNRENSSVKNREKKKQIELFINKNDLSYSKRLKELSKREIYSPTTEFQKEMFFNIPYLQSSSHDESLTEGPRNKVKNSKKYSTKSKSTLRELSKLTVKAMEDKVIEEIVRGFSPKKKKKTTDKVRIIRLKKPHKHLHKSARSKDYFSEEDAECEDKKKKHLAETVESSTPETVSDLDYKSRERYMLGKNLFDNGRNEKFSKDPSGNNSKDYDNIKTSNSLQNDENYGKKLNSNKVIDFTNMEELELQLKKSLQQKLGINSKDNNSLNSNNETSNTEQNIHSVYEYQNEDLDYDYDLHSDLNISESNDCTDLKEDEMVRLWEKRASKSTDINDGDEKSIVDGKLWNVLVDKVKKDGGTALSIPGEDMVLNENSLDKFTQSSDVDKACFDTVDGPTNSNEFSKIQDQRDELNKSYEENVDNLNSEVNNVEFQNLLETNALENEKGNTEILKVITDEFEVESKIENDKMHTQPLENETDIFLEKEKALQLELGGSFKNVLEENKLFINQEETADKAFECHSNQDVRQNFSTTETENNKPLEEVNFRASLEGTSKFSEKDNNENDEKGGETSKKDACKENFSKNNEEVTQNSQQNQEKEEYNTTTENSESTLGLMANQQDCSKKEKKHKSKRDYMHSKETSHYPSETKKHGRRRVRNNSSQTQKVEKKTIQTQTDVHLSKTKTRRFIDQCTQYEPNKEDLGQNLKTLTNKTMDDSYPSVSIPDKNYSEFSSPRVVIDKLVEIDKQIDMLLKCRQSLYRCLYSHSDLEEISANSMENTLISKTQNKRMINEEQSNENPLKKVKADKKTFCQETQTSCNKNLQNNRNMRRQSRLLKLLNCSMINRRATQKKRRRVVPIKASANEDLKNIFKERKTVEIPTTPSAQLTNEELKENSPEGKTLEENIRKPCLQLTHAKLKENSIEGKILEENAKRLCVRLTDALKENSTERKNLVENITKESSTKAVTSEIPKKNNVISENREIESSKKNNVILEKQEIEGTLFKKVENNVQKSMVLLQMTPEKTIESDEHTLKDVKENCDEGTNNFYLKTKISKIQDINKKKEDNHYKNTTAEIINEKDSENKEIEKDVLQSKRGRKRRFNTQTPTIEETFENQKHAEIEERKNADRSNNQYVSENNSDLDTGPARQKRTGSKENSKRENLSHFSLTQYNEHVKSGDSLKNVQDSTTNSKTNNNDAIPNENALKNKLTNESKSDKTFPERNTELIVSKAKKRQMRKTKPEVTEIEGLDQNVEEINLEEKNQQKVNNSKEKFKSKPQRRKNNDMKLINVNNELFETFFKRKCVVNLEKLSLDQMKSCYENFSDRHSKQVSSDMNIEVTIIDDDKKCLEKKPCSACKEQEQLVKKDEIFLEKEDNVEILGELEIKPSDLGDEKKQNNNVNDILIIKDSENNLKNNEKHKTTMTEVMEIKEHENAPLDQEKQKSNLHEVIIVNDKESSLKSKNKQSDNVNQVIVIEDNENSLNNKEKQGNNVKEAVMVEENSLKEIEFSGFEGAILVIKVISVAILAASDKGKLYCYNIQTGDLLHVFNIGLVAVTSLCILKNDSSEDLIYTGSLDHKLNLYNFATKENIKTEIVGEPIQCMEYAWNYLFIGSDRGSIMRYDLLEKKIEAKEKISDLNVLVLKATVEGPRKVLLVATRNSPVTVRDAMSGLLMRTMEAPFSPTVYTLLFEKNLVYCGTSQHDILVYTFEDGQLIFKHEATKSKGVVCMQIVGDLLFAGCYNGNIYIYNIKTNKYLGTMSGPGGLMLSMEIVNDKIIVGTKSSKFKLWKIPDQYLKENKAVT